MRLYCTIFPLIRPAYKMIYNREVNFQLFLETIGWNSTSLRSVQFMDLFEYPIQSLMSKGIKELTDL